MTPLRIALAYFGFVPLQRWINGIFGTLLAVGLLWATVRGADSAEGGLLTLCLVSAVIMVLGPAFTGGAMLRTASSPTVLHLRPHGRRHMLLGTTLAITLIAVIVTSPTLVFQLAGLPMPGRMNALDNPVLVAFGFSWGCAALLWVVIFAVSRSHAMFAASFVLVVAMANTAAWLLRILHVPAERIAQMLFALGAVAWLAFALWYATTAVIRRSGWMSAWASGQAQPLLADFSLRRWFGKSVVSRPVAFCQYLSGTDSVLNRAAWTACIPAGLTAWYVAMATRPGFQMLPVQNLFFFTLYSAGNTMLLARRGRLVWLRAGLDRAGLFAEAQRNALRAQLVIFTIPLAVFVPVSMFQRPDLAAAIALYVAMQFAGSTCLLYASLSVTRKWNAESIAVCTALYLLYVLATTTVSPGNSNAAAWGYLCVAVVFVALTVVLRSYARRAWIRLDWRLSGPPVQTQGWGGR